MRARELELKDAVTIEVTAAKLDAEGKASCEGCMFEVTKGRRDCTGLIRALKYAGIKDCYPGLIYVAKKD